MIEQATQNLPKAKKLREPTKKQRTFLEELTRNGGDYTKAVMKAYNVEGNSASVIAHQLKNNPNLQEKITKISEAMGFGITEIIYTIIQRAKRDDNASRHWMKMLIDITGQSAPKQTEIKSHKTIDIEVRRKQSIHEAVVEAINNNRIQTEDAEIT